MVLLRFVTELKLQYPIIKNNFNEMTNYSEMAKIAKGKMLLKEYEQKDNSLSFTKKPMVVYLEDGDEFQIQLFNPTNQVIGAKIEFNGEASWYSSDKYIVLRPGERVWLERYLDTPHKFKFNTYSVSGGKETKEAIKDNGLLRIKFFNEDKKPCYDNTIITCSSPHVFYDGPLTGTYYCSGVNDIGSSSAVLGSCVDTLGFASTAATGYATSASTISANVNTKSVKSDNDGGTRCRRSMSKSIETGMVEEGSYSRQDFNHVYYNFVSYPFFTKEIQILPMSRKQYSKDDLRKVYCTNCGKKLSTKYKFCPACGTKVNY